VQHSSTLIGPLTAILYPLWLAAGGIDYLCHRRTNIELTSGIRECGFHVAQFAALVVAIVLSTMLALTGMVLAMLIAVVAVHSALSYADVSYTQGRRHISPLEQHVHGFMDVLPVVAVCLLAVLNWHDIWSSPWQLQLDDNPLDLRKLVLLGTFVLFTGGPVLEELWRTWKCVSRRLNH
jgi:hypothetical protein